MRENDSQALLQSDGLTITPSYVQMSYKNLEAVFFLRAVASLTLGRKKMKKWPYGVILVGIALLFFEGEDVKIAGVCVMVIGALLAFFLFPRYALQVRLASGEEYALITGRHKRCNDVFLLLRDCCAKSVQCAGLGEGASVGAEQRELAQSAGRGA